MEELFHAFRAGAALPDKVRTVMRETPWTPPRCDGLQSFTSEATWQSVTRVFILLTLPRGQENGSPRPVCKPVSQDSIRGLV